VKRRIYALDIETIPQTGPLADAMAGSDIVDKRLADPSPIHKVEALNLIRQAQGITLGNRTDPDKIREHFSEQVDNIAASASKACSFDPLAGRVCAIAVAGRMGDSVDGAVKTLADFADADDLFDDPARAAAEKKLLAWWWRLANSIDGLVTWNGIGFDLPFLERRSVLSGVAPSRSYETPRYRYWPHLDLMQWWARWESRNWTGLDKMARALGLAGKSGMDGSQVASYADDGRWAEIGAYCLADAKDRTWPIYELFAGIIPGHGPTNVEEK